MVGDAVPGKVCCLKWAVRQVSKDVISRRGSGGSYFLVMLKFLNREGFNMTDHPAPTPVLKPSPTMINCKPLKKQQQEEKSSSLMLFCQRIQSETQESKTETGRQ